MTLWHVFVLLLVELLALTALANEDVCASGSDAIGACKSERQQQSLLQQHFQKGNIVLTDTETSSVMKSDAERACPPGGAESVNRCWYLGETGASCDATCGARGLSYSYAAPVEDITPLLVGHTPSTKQAPWLFVECYVQNEDRYHPASLNAWGVPGKTPNGELAEVGQHTYPSCRLSCPCAPSGSVGINSAPTPSAGGGAIGSPSSGSSMTCSGIEANERCWYLSEIGDNCDNTCAAQGPGCTYRFGVPPAGDISPRLIGHEPHGKQDPWLFVECYVPKEDRYHPYNPMAWGTPENTPHGELARAGVYSYETCRLGCSCQGICTGSSPTPAGPGSNVGPTTNLPRCADGVGMAANGRCWYLSDLGDSCDNTCAAHGFAYSYSEPPAGDMVPRLIGHAPAGKQNPWLFLECYVPTEDRYHPFNANAWGVPEKTPAGELAQAGQYKYETCRLSCPCAGPGMAPSPIAGPGPGLAHPSLFKCEGGLVQNERCWYLSHLGESCASTCSAHGCNYRYQAPPEGDMVPELLGHEPHGKQQPWLFVECYVPQEDRYHPVNPKAWGTPENTPAGEELKAAQYSYETCRLSCPCEGACSFIVGEDHDLPVPAPLPSPPFSPPLPVPAPFPSPPMPGPSVPASGMLCQDGIGLYESGRCWYLSDTGATCDATCAARGSTYSYASTTEDIVPKLIGHEPSGKQDAWLFVECYVPKEDRYHPANPNAWGVPSKTPANEVSKAGQYKYEKCRLACPCAGAPAPSPFPSPSPLPPAVGSGVTAVGRTWFMGKEGESCDQTCSARGPGCQYSFAMPEQDMTPLLVGHQPAGVQKPWLFVECYHAREDRYHPVNPNAWGVPAKTPVKELPTAGGYVYDDCSLACPCMGTCGPSAPSPSPNVGPPVGPVPGGTGGPAWDGRITGNGMQAAGRTWYMSEEGANCKDTCGARNLVYSWAYPGDSSITPDLLGHEPAVKQDPWAFVECYVQREDRYHTVNTNGWGVPAKTPAADMKKSAEWSQEECRLACPCTQEAEVQCRWEQPAACAPQFEWKGVIYSGCPRVDHDSPWCQHHLHHTEEWLTDWSNCIYTCDANQQPTATPASSNCRWTPANDCVSEFNYEGALVVGCTNTDYHSPWCSKSKVYDGTWAHCSYQCDNPNEEDLKQIAELNKWAESESELCSWQPPAACSPKFQYRNTEYTGCAIWVDSPTPWCSHDRVHIGKWSSCERVCKQAS